MRSIVLRSMARLEERVDRSSKFYHLGIDAEVKMLILAQ